ncbi:MAG: fumarylacetoacetate hydrolase family protein [Candidatus Binatia bacterium]
MRIVTYRHRGASGTGILAGDRVVDLTRALGALYRRRDRPRAIELAAFVAPPADVVRLLEGGEEALDDARVAIEHVAPRIAAEAARCKEEGLLFDAGEVALGPPVRNPGKIACMWVNYLAHGKEVSVDAPKTDPVFFSKFPGVAIGPGDPIVLPRVSRQVDYEAELAVVIGREAKHVPEERALDVVAGYTVLNDVSARDFNLDQVVGAVAPYIIQKTFDTFAPMGPALVTRDEVPDPQHLPIRLWIDGELLQDGNTERMVFGVRQIVSFLSKVVTLRPGDVISTGTPPGSGHWRKPPRYLRAGNRVRIEVGGVGVLENPVIDEA